jgi:TRAP transporter TAXI family solute receptor
MFSASNGSRHTPFRLRFILYFTAIIILAQPFTATAYEIIIGTGPEGTFKQYCGKVLCRILEKQDSEITCGLTTSPDEVDLLTNVQGGSLDMALIDSHLLFEALQGSGPFAYLDIRYDRVRVVAPLYQRPITFVVRKDAGILSSDQLPGKRVNTGPAGSSTKRLFDLIMQTEGWSGGDFPNQGELSSSLSQDKIAFRQGAIQALVHQGVHPDPSIEQLILDSKAHVVGITGQNVSSMIAKTPSLSQQEIGSNSYPLVSEEIITFGTTMTLVTSADMDAATARVIASALIDKGKSLQALHPSLESFQLSAQKSWFGGLKVHEAVLEQLKKP